MTKVRCVMAAAGKCKRIGCKEWGANETAFYAPDTDCPFMPVTPFVVSARRKIKPTCGNCGHYDGKCNTPLPRCIDLFRRYQISKRTDATHCKTWTPCKELMK